MSVGFFLIIGATFCVALVAAWFLVAPFLDAEAELPGSAMRDTVQLCERRDALLEQLAELENEFQLGDLAAADFEATRGELVSEIGRLIAQIEEGKTTGKDDTGAEINVHARAAERQ